MTNAIGTGTVNLVINVPADERSALGRAAFKRRAKSVGAFVRKLLLAGAELECPELAAQLKKIRFQYYGSAALLLMFCGLLAASWFSRDELDLRRTRRASARSVRCVREGRVEA